MSDNVDVDLSNYKDRVGQRVLEGRYRVLVEDAETDTARSGNTMINLWLRIVGGEFDGATIVDRLVLTDKSLFRVVGFMQAIGMATPKKKLRVNVRQFVGKQLDIDVEDGDPYNGRIKSEVRGYFRIEGKGAGTGVSDIPLTEEELEAGLDEFKADEEREAAKVNAGSNSVAETEGEPATEEVDLDKLDLG
jgi:hypothetical protein